MLWVPRFEVLRCEVLDHEDERDQRQLACHRPHPRADDGVCVVGGGGTGGRGGSCWSVGGCLNRGSWGRFERSSGDYGRDAVDW